MTDKEVLEQLAKLWGNLGEKPSTVELEKAKEQTKAALVSYQQYGKV